MTHPNTLTSQARSTMRVDGLEVEVFATEQEARAAFAAVPSYVEQQAAAFVAAVGSLASAGEYLHRGLHVVRHPHSCDACRPQEPTIPLTHPCSAASEVSSTVL